MARAPSAYLMTIKLNKEGQSYQHYLKDEKGQKVLRVNATPAQLAMAKNADTPLPKAQPVEGVEAVASTATSTSQWLMVKKTAKSGKVYQHYLKDSKGQRILRATATPEQIAMTTKIQGQKTEKEVKRVKNSTKKLNKIIKAKNKNRKISIEVQALLRDTFDGQKRGTKNIRSGEYYDRQTDYHVVMFDTETDWLLLHSTTKKGQQQFVEGWFFYNPYNGDWAEFDIVHYLAAPKEEKIINWPTRSSKEAA